MQEQPEPRPLLVARDRDAKAAAVAASLQKAWPAWLIIWSRWHQTFTGFACFTREPVIVDDAEATTFLAHLAQVQLANAM